MDRRYEPPAIEDRTPLLGLMMQPFSPGTAGASPLWERDEPKGRKGRKRAGGSAT